MGTMKQDAKILYATASPWRLFFIVTIPGMVSMLAMSIYSVLEGIFIGQTLGESAFAAVNIAYPIIMINFAISDLIGVGASVPISIALGRKDDKAANNIFSASLILILLAAFTMGAFMFLFAEDAARLMGAEESVVASAAAFVRTYAVCSPLCTLFFAMDNFLRICGYVRYSMVINILNSVLMFPFVYVFLFVCEMGVVGAALATCVAMCICSILALIPFLRGRTLLRFSCPLFSFAMIREIVACGSPVFLNNIAGRVTAIFLNLALVRLGSEHFGLGGGTTAVACYAVLLYAADMCQPLLYGMSDSLAPAIGFNFGAQNYSRVKKLLLCNCIGAILVSIVSVALLFFFAPVIAALFVDGEENPVLLTLATHALRLFCTAYLFRWFSLVSQHFLSAIERPLLATTLSVSIAFFGPIITLGALWPLGLDGIWLNLLGTSLITTLIGAVLLHIGLRPLKEKTHDNPA